MYFSSEPFSSILSLLLPLSVICSRSLSCALSLPFPVLFPSLCPRSHPPLQLDLVFLHSKCFSLSGGIFPLSSHHQFLTCHTLPAWPLSVYICVYLSHSPPPLSAIFFFHFSFFYLGAHSSPPTLEILTK